VECAVNGEEALEKFEISKPGTYSAIIMDIQMPIMDGYEATKKIRRSDHTQAKTIPIIAMTANVFAEDVQKALTSGMNAHISKPISIDALSKTFDSLKEKGDLNE
ncbi:MAG: response regulator, partial [Oscillospiraceae bacterium]